MRAWRWPVRLLIPGLLIAGIVVDPQLRRDVDVVEVGADLPAVAAVPGLDQLSSTWFCPTVHLEQVDGRGVGAEVDLVVTNLSEEPTDVLVELLSPTSPSRSLKVAVPPGETQRVVVEADATDDVVSAIVEAPHGGIMVSREFHAGGAVDAARCASRPSTRWYLPTGDTQRDATNEVVVFNPLPSDAVVDLVFATEAETGTFVAVDLEGLVVAPRSVVRIDVGEYVRRRDVVATTITTRAGRVVVDQFQSYDGSAGRRGTSASLAIADSADRWLYPGGYIADDAVLEVAVLNPTDQVAEVDLASISPLGGGNPVAITIGPRDVAVVPVRPFLDLPPAVPTLEVVPAEVFGVLVESANGVPVVVAVELGAGANTAPSDEAVDDGQLGGDSDNEDVPSVQDGESAGVGEEPEGQTGAGRAGRPRASSGRAIVPAAVPGWTRWAVTVPAQEGGVAYMAVQSSAPEAVAVSIREVGGSRSEDLLLDGNDLEVLTIALDVTLVIEGNGPFVASVMVETVDGAGLIGLAPVEF